MGSKRYSTKRIKASQLPTAPPPSQPTSSSPHVQTVTSQRTASTGLGYTPEGWVLEGRQPGCILNRKLSRDTLGHILIQDNLTVLRIPMSVERSIKEGSVRDNGTSTGAAYNLAKTGGFESVMQNLKVSAMRSQGSQGTSGSWSAPATAVGSFASDVQDGGRRDNQSKTELPVKEATKEKDVKAGVSEGVEAHDFGNVVENAKVAGKEKEEDKSEKAISTDEEKGKDSSEVDQKKDVIMKKDTTATSDLDQRADANPEQNGDKVEQVPAGAQNDDKNAIIADEETATAKSEPTKVSKDDQVAESVDKVNKPPSTEQEQAPATIHNTTSNKIEAASADHKASFSSIPDTTATKANNEKDATEVNDTNNKNRDTTAATDPAIAAPQEKPADNPEQEPEVAMQASQNIDNKKPETANATGTPHAKRAQNNTQQEKPSINDEKEARKIENGDGQKIASGGH